MCLDKSNGGGWNVLLWKKFFLVHEETQYCDTWRWMLFLLIINSFKLSWDFVVSLAIIVGGKYMYVHVHMQEKFSKWMLNVHIKSNPSLDTYLSLSHFIPMPLCFSLIYLILWNLWLSDDMHLYPSIFNVHVVVVLQVQFNFNAEQPISHAIWQRLMSHVGLQWYMPLISWYQKSQL